MKLLSLERKCVKVVKAQNIRMSTYLCLLTSIKTQVKEHNISKIELQIITSILRSKNSVGGPMDSGIRIHF